jgi:hypothetical protein
MQFAARVILAMMAMLARASVAMTATRRVGVEEYRKEERVASHPHNPPPSKAPTRNAVWRPF